MWWNKYNKKIREQKVDSRHYELVTGFSPEVFRKPNRQFSDAFVSMRKHYKFVFFFHRHIHWFLMIVEILLTAAYVAVSSALLDISIIYILLIAPLIFPIMIPFWTRVIMFPSYFLSMKYKNKMEWEKIFLNNLESFSFLSLSGYKVGIEKLEEVVHELETKKRIHNIYKTDPSILMSSPVQLREMRKGKIATHNYLFQYNGSANWYSEKYNFDKDLKYSNSTKTRNLFGEYDLNPYIHPYSFDFETKNKFEFFLVLKFYYIPYMGEPRRYANLKEPLWRLYRNFLTGPMADSEDLLFDLNNNSEIIPKFLKKHNHRKKVLDLQVQEDKRNYIYDNKNTIGKEYVFSNDDKYILPFDFAELKSRNEVNINDDVIKNIIVNPSAYQFNLGLFSKHLAKQKFEKSEMKQIEQFINDNLNNKNISFLEKSYMVYWLNRFTNNNLESKTKDYDSNIFSSQSKDRLGNTIKHGIYTIINNLDLYEKEGNLYQKKMDKKIKQLLKDKMSYADIWLQL